MRFFRSISRQALFLLASLLLIIGSGGGTTLLSQLIAGSCLLILLTVYPLTHRGLKLLAIITSVWLAYLGLILLIPHTLLPDSYWREACRTLGLDLASGLSPQPLVSIVTVGYYMLISGWIIWIIDSTCNRLSRRILIQSTAWAITLLAALSLLGNRLAWRLPWNQYAESFSFFPNKNQSALLYVVGGVLMLGIVIDKWHTPLWRRALYLAASLTCLIAALSLGNRSALLLFPVGMGLIAIRNLRYKKHRQFKGILALGTLILGLGLAMNNRGLDRLLATASSDTAAHSFTRLDIWKDTLSAISDNKLTGFGPGNFSYLVPFYKQATQTEYELLHPENTWLWLLADGGLLLVLVLCVATFLIFNNYRLDRDALKDSLYHTALIALLLIVLHSLVDVSLNRLGIIMIAALLLACLLAHHTQHGERAGRFRIRLFCGLLGVIPLLTIIAPHYGLKELGPSEVLAASRRPHLLTGQPLDWRTQFYLAQDHLKARQFAEATRAFERTQILADFNPQVMYRIGQEWLYYSPTHALSAWRGALQPKALHRTDLFAQIMAKISHNNALQQAILPLIQDETSLLANWIQRVPPQLALESIPQLLNNATQTPRADWDLLDRPLARIMAKNPSSQSAHLLTSSTIQQVHLWRCTTIALIRTGKCDEALAFGLKHLPLPFEPKSLTEETFREVKHDFQAKPADPYPAQRLIAHQAATENWDGVLATIKKIRTTNNNPPEWVNYWQVRASMAKGQTATACTALEACL